MRLTTKGRYAVTAMLDLALHESQGPITLADISQRQGVSISYLEQLFAKLRRNQLVESVRGPGGGYRLSGGAANISVAQIVEAVNDSMDATRCRGKGDCQSGDVCLTHHLWSDLSDRLREFLDDISLAELVARKEIRRVSDRQDQLGCSRSVPIEPLERII
ncbi:Fe-S cluster assembly transcriptional regulator IscR [Halopseudomonas salegens]|uniref:Transcriptional regulator, BadM/Rrf2 family n=1 Tax=Halopseudomonas salegens TaxID=1434072 RepID=A0A1H2F535_9GAMM|nr:Fe-S cluster assembly transcriptional regulator IscR [Halopseudomonas salegens]SDU02427.1 transcriptional regulator, BadM/Rrf2 family [Halopseudomonas salegens]